jgi:hypothetical protein
MRSYHKRLLNEAYRTLSARKKSFDYMDVMRLLPSGDHSPIEREVWREMRASKDLELVTPGTKHRRARYRLKPGRRRPRRH